MFSSKRSTLGFPTAALVLASVAGPVNAVPTHFISPEKAGAPLGLLLDTAGALARDLSSLRQYRSTTQTAGENKTERWNYRGFTVDYSRLDQPFDEDTRKNVAAQIDMACELRVSTDVKSFFQTMVVSLVSKRDLVGQFGGGRFVNLGASKDPDDRPILVHELMHAYHFFMLKDGYDNSDIKNFYREAREQSVYDKSAIIMHDLREYFAVTASLFLTGNVRRPPFTREGLRTAQPDYYNFLVRLFGYDPEGVGSQP